MKKRQENQKGRPSDYSVEYGQEYIQKASIGQLDCQIYASWGISKTTFYRWQEKYPEFKDAVERGNAQYEAYFATNILNKLVSGELEGKHSYKAAELLAKNKLNYRSKDLDEAQTININNMQVIQNTNTRDLLAKIQQSVEKFQDRGIDIPFKVLKNDENKPE